MLLAANAGNTHIAVGVFVDAELVAHWRLSSRTHRTSDEFYLALRDLLSDHEFQIDSSVMCSVVPQLTEAVGGGLTTLTQKAPLRVSAEIRLPVALDIEDPSEIGGDLIANAAGGYTSAGGSCVVVDFGTALSFTAVDESGRVAGVAIAPGIDSGVDGLVSNTAALPMVDLAWPDSYLGRNTHASLRAGILYGYAGLVDRVACGMADEMRSNPIVMATGGHAPLMAPHCSCVQRTEPWLTLEGLRAIAELNQST